MRGSIICLSIILFVCLLNNAGAQRLNYNDTIKLAASQQIIKNISRSTSCADQRFLLKPLNLLPANHYAKTAGFFCKKEIEIDKVTRLPLRFRLGSVAYTDKMESKNSYMPVVINSN